MNDVDEKNLRKLFQELARDGEKAAPPFRVPAAEGRRRRSIRRPLLAAVAAAVLAVAGPAVLNRLRVRSAETTGTVASIASWSAPTGFLLETPGRELLSSTSYDAVAPVTKSAMEARRQP
jgi:hypothetical protein